jgi:hypothetical protein
LLLAGGASAQGKDPAAAQALFETGKRLMAEDRAAEACPKLEESLKLDDAIGTRFQLARCYELVGRVASAWTLYLEVAAAARSSSQNDREAFARAEASRLKPMLSALTIVVPQEARVPGLEVKRNQVPVGSGQWGLALPVDPGQYQISVAAPGKKPWVGTIEVRGTAARESFTIPKLVDAPEEPKELSAKEKATSAGDVSTRTDGASATRTQLTTLHFAGIGAAALGVVGLGVGGVFAWSAKSKNDDSGCDGGACPDQDALEKNQEAVQAGNVATVAVIAGGVLAAAGATVFLLAPREAAPESAPVGASLQVSPVVAGRFAGLFFQGSF